MKTPTIDAATILLVDDEDAVQKLLTYPLEHEGFRVLQARDGEEALRRFDADAVDLVVLDVMLPKMDGLEVCRRLRMRSSVPIIMLTARDDELDKVVGLELGADDYITKPFSIREFRSRVRALLRRAALAGEGDGRERIVLEGLVIDLARRTVETDAGALRFDLLTVIPTNTAMAFVIASGLGDPFIDVDLATFRSSRDPRVYAVGDVADTPFAKTASTAISCAKMAARAIARTWGATVGEPTLPRNLCFPVVSRERALMIDTEWRLEAEPSGAVHVETRGTTDVDPKPSHLGARRAWEARVLREMFGA